MAEAQALRKKRRLFSMLWQNTIKTNCTQSLTQKAWCSRTLSHPLHTSGTFRNWIWKDDCIALRFSLCVRVCIDWKNGISGKKIFQKDSQSEKSPEIPSTFSVCPEKAFFLFWNFVRQNLRQFAQTMFFIFLQKQPLSEFFRNFWGRLSRAKIFATTIQQLNSNNTQFVYIHSYFLKHWQQKNSSL